jgi:hypothetical protein
MSSSLRAFDLTPTSDAKLSGLVAIRGPRGKLRVDEEAAILEAEAISGLDYVYFRRFADGRSSQIAAYVVNNEDERLTEIALAELHKEVWLHGAAPLLYVGWPMRVDVLSCARGPDFWKKNECRYHPVIKIPVAFDSELPGLAGTSAEISSALEAQRRFSAHRLADGTFWEDPKNAKLAQGDRSAHRRLIEAVVAADADINGEKNPLLRRLLLLTVLVKYLEDRGVFPSEGWFGRFHKGARSFFDLLKQGSADEVRAFFDHLEGKFNGDVFSLPEEGKRKLTTTALRRFAEMVESRTIGDQRYLWEQYSFRHLPVEVLSHLYQRFAQKGKGAIFTPPFVASLLLDYAMPYGSLTGKERVLDPTCGSGIFLVGAFRRLVNVWRSQNNWEKPDVGSLKDILKQSIFGVEIQEEALHLAAFSLALAVCDALKPKVIWNDLRFEKLQPSNLRMGDFFDFVDNQPARFDVVVGNPPFQSKLTDPADRLNKSEIGARGALPDKQIAYLVAEQVMKLLDNGGRLCLIQPSSILYNEKAKAFSRRFFQTYKMEAILDFSSVRGLFDKADTKIVALVCRRAKPTLANRMEHLTFRRTVTVDEQLGFELDYYDRHRVTQHQATDVSYTWKVNLLGGGRLHHLASRLKEMGTVEQFVTAKGWEYGEGYIAAETGKRTKESWLKGLPLLPSVALTESGVDESKITVVTEECFRSAYTIARYTSPLVLIRENEGLQSAFWNKGTLAYKAQIVGVSAPPARAKELKKFGEDFAANRAVLKAFCLLLGTRALVGKATAINKTDIDSLPWPEPGESWDLANWEAVVCEDLLDYMADYVRLGQDSQLLKKSAGPAELKSYALAFCETLKGIYPNLQPGEAQSFHGLTCQSFYFGDRPDVDWPASWEAKIHELVYVQRGAALRTVRVVRIYESNVVFILKPDRLRYWIRSVAIRDADETLAELHQQGF